MIEKISSNSSIFYPARQDCTLLDVAVINGTSMFPYLDDEALSSYKQVFHNADLLTDDERKNTQEQIDLFTKGRKKQ